MNGARGRSRARRARLRLGLHGAGRIRIEVERGDQRECLRHVRARLAFDRPLLPRSVRLADLEAPDDATALAFRDRNADHGRGIARLREPGPIRPCPDGRKERRRVGTGAARSLVEEAEPSRLRSVHGLRARDRRRRRRRHDERDNDGSYVHGSDHRDHASLTHSPSAVRLVRDARPRPRHAGARGQFTCGSGAALIGRLPMPPA